MRLALAVTLSLASLVSAPVLAQEPPSVGPGAEALDPSVLKPFSATYKMTRGGKDWATAVIDLRRASVAGVPALRHGYSMYFGSQTVYDETLFRKDTLAPLLKFIHGGMPPELAYKLYTFNGKQVRGSTVFADGREPATLERTLDSEAFGGGTDYLVAAALPLRKGFVATLLSADDSGVHPGELQVLGKETLKIGSKTYETWIVSMQGGQAKRWIAREAPYMIKLEAPAVGIAWELVEVISAPKTAS